MVKTDATGCYLSKNYIKNLTMDMVGQPDTLPSFECSNYKYIKTLSP